MAQDKAENTFVMFFIGLAIGGAVTALLTPRKGQDIRRTIKNRVNDMKNSASTKVDEIADAADTKLQDTKDAIKSGRNKLKSEEINQDMIL